MSLLLPIVHRMICMDQLPHITMVYNQLYTAIKYSETNDYNILLYRMITIGLQLYKHVIQSPWYLISQTIPINENILYAYNREDYIVGITMEYHISNIYHRFFCIMSYIWSILYHMITTVYQLTSISL